MHICMVAIGFKRIGKGVCIKTAGVLKPDSRSKPIYMYDHACMQLCA